MNMHKILTVLVLVLIGVQTHAQGRTVDVRMPLVEETLRFLKSQSLDPPADALLLRAGALRICGEKLDGQGCKPPGFIVPEPDATDPQAMRAWRSVLESALAGARIRGGKKFDSTAIQRYIMDGMVTEVGDPASFYLVPSVYKKIASIPSSFVGFGLRVTPGKNELNITAVHTGSPASTAELRSGDRIVAVNGNPVTGYHRPGALAAIWGADGSPLKLTIEGEKRESRTVDLKYKRWTFRAYKISRVDDVVIIKVNHFDTGLLSAVRKAIDETVKGIVLDLVDAGSGYESEMVGLADILLPGGEIGSKKMRSDLGSKVWKAKAETEGEQVDLPLAVVVNQGTSGLSEVVAAAIRKHTRGVLVGRTTAGNDTQETLRTLKDGSAIQVTSTRFVGPGDESLSAGIKPHVMTKRVAITDLAVEIIKTTSGASIEQLLEAAKTAVNKQ
jgi:carboxyl-terminal processing protease